MLFDNIGRLASSAAAFAAFIAGRWVAGMVVAAASVRGLATALVFLRGALIRTGIGAVVVAAGELIYQFGRLVQASGGFGAALGLLGDVASEVWERIGILAEILQARIGAAWSGIQARVAETLQGALETVVSFGNQTVSTFQGAFDAMVVIWSNLPATIGDLTIRAANALIAGLEAMLNGAVGGINRLLDSVNAGLAAIGVERSITLVPEIDLARIENEVAGAAGRAGTAASEAFAAAFETNAFNAPDIGLSALCRECARGRGWRPRHRGGARRAGRCAAWPPWQHCVRRWLAPIPRSTTRQRRPSVWIPPSRRSAVLVEARQEKQEVRGGSAAGAAEASRTAGQAIGAAADQAVTGWAAVRDALARYADDAMDWGKGVGTALTSAFRSAEDALASFVTGGKIDFKGFADSLQADLTRIAIRSAILGPLAGALGGAGRRRGIRQSVWRQRWWASGGHLPPGRRRRWSGHGASRACLGVRRRTPSPWRRHGGAARGRGAGHPATRRDGAVPGSSRCDGIGAGHTAPGQRGHEHLDPRCGQLSAKPGADRRRCRPRDAASAAESLIGYSARILLTSPATA